MTRMRHLPVVHSIYRATSARQNIVVMAGSSRLRGRSPFGAAKARPPTFLPYRKKDADARDKRGHDEL